MMFRRAFLIAAALMCALSPFSAARAQDNDNHALLAAGGAGGWLNVVRSLTAEDMKGRLVLLDFWTYGCINCMQVVPDLEALENTFGDRLLIIGVHSAKFAAEQGSDRILAAAKRFGLTHPVVNDSDFAIWKKFDVKAWPTLVLLGADGAEISRYSGEGHHDALERDINEAVNKAADGPAPATPVAALVAPREQNGILSFPARLAYGNNMLFIADSGHNRILAVDEAGHLKMTVGSGERGARNGAAAQASFNQPRGLAVLGDAVYVADTGNHLIRRISIATGAVETVAGTGTRGHDHVINNAPALKTQLASPWDLEVLADGHTLAIAMAGMHQLWTLDLRHDTVTVLAGNGWESIEDGQASRASLAQPSGLSLAGRTLFFVDAESSALRRLGTNGNVQTLIGTGLFDFGNVDGAYPNAKLQHPQGLYADAERVIVADTYNNALRLYDLKTGMLSTLTLTGPALNEPGDVLAVNGRVYVADTNNNAVRTVDIITGAVSTLEIVP